MSTMQRVISVSRKFCEYMIFCLRINVKFAKCSSMIYSHVIVHLLEL